MVRLSIFLALSLLMSGCANTGLISEIPVDGQNAVYRLDSGDRLRVIVFGQTELSGEYAVDGAGQISIPLINVIQARGLTTDELEETLVSVLSQTLLRDPSVNVEVLTFRLLPSPADIRTGQMKMSRGLRAISVIALLNSVLTAIRLCIRVTRSLFENVTSEAFIVGNAIA